MLGKRKLRKTVFELLFGYEFNKEITYEEYYNNAYDNFIIEDDEQDSVRNMFFGIVRNIEAIDAEISKYLKEWKISRLSKSSLAILRVGAFEIIYTDLPNAIAINEAVELAKKYAEEGAPSYINGVLNNMSKGLNNKNA